MADQPKRPPFRVYFHFNIDTGEIDLIIDDDSPDRTEIYHDEVAEFIASYLARHPEIEDAGPIRPRLNQRWEQAEHAAQKRDMKRKEDDEEETLVE